jgi:hypothetical protein
LFAYNASDNGCIVLGEWRTDKYENCPIGDQWHPKGMAVTPKFVVSGYSEHAVSTPRRFVSRSGLVFVDRASWEVQNMTDILVGDKYVGNVNEVRLYEPRRNLRQSTRSESRTQEPASDVPEVWTGTPPERPREEIQWPLVV